MSSTIPRMRRLRPCNNRSCVDFTDTRSSTVPLAHVHPQKPKDTVLQPEQKLMFKLQCACTKHYCSHSCSDGSTGTLVCLTALRSAEQRCTTKEKVHKLRKVFFGPKRNSLNLSTTIVDTQTSVSLLPSTATVGISNASTMVT